MNAKRATKTRNKYRPVTHPSLFIPLLNKNLCVPVPLHNHWHFGFSRYSLTIMKFQFPDHLRGTGIIGNISSFQHVLLIAVIACALHNICWQSISSITTNWQKACQSLNRYYYIMICQHRGFVWSTPYRDVAAGELRGRKYCLTSTPV